MANASVPVLVNASVLPVEDVLIMGTTNVRGTETSCVTCFIRNSILYLQAVGRGANVGAKVELSVPNTPNPYLKVRTAHKKFSTSNGNK